MRTRSLIIKDPEDNVIGVVPMKKKDFKMIKNHAASCGMTVDEYLLDIIKTSCRQR